MPRARGGALLPSVHRQKDSSGRIIKNKCFEPVVVQHSKTHRDSLLHSAILELFELFTRRTSSHRHLAGHTRRTVTARP